MTTQTITARFPTLRKAVAEARKYGVTQQYSAIETCITTKKRFTHYITCSRALTITRLPGKGWKMAVDVQGRVVPVHANARKVPVVGRLTAEARKKTAIQQAFVNAVGMEA